MVVPLVNPRLRRSLSAVYRFYDAFLYPLDDRTAPVTAPLDVSIPSLRWSAWWSEEDSTYRFSALTLRQPAPAGVGLEVRVVARNGDYAAFDPLTLTLPRAVSTPPARADFLVPTPLWPTVAMRPPAGETVVRGTLRDNAARPAADRKVEMWTGTAAVPPAGTPFTRTNADGDFLFRFPRLAASGPTVALRARVNGGADALASDSWTVPFGQTRIIPLQLT